MAAVLCPRINHLFRSGCWNTRWNSVIVNTVSYRFFTHSASLLRISSRRTVNKYNLSFNHQSKFWGNFIGTGGVSLGFLGFLFGSKDDEKPEDKVVMHIKKGILYMEREEYDAAETEFSHAFHLSRKYGFEDALSQVTSYQANLAFKRGNLARAENCFKFLSQRLVALKTVTVTDNSFVEISLKLAEIYAKTGRYDEALSGFQYCVLIQKEKIDGGVEDEDTLVLGAWSLHNLSQAYIRLASGGDKEDIHLAKAIFCLKKAESYLTQALGTEAEQSIAIKSDLATALSLKGDHAGAVKLFNEITPIAKEKYAELYATIRVNVGNIYLQKSEFQQANQICLEVKSLASKFRNLEAFHRADECVKKSLTGIKGLESASASA